MVHRIRVFLRPLWIPVYLSLGYFVVQCTQIEKYGATWDEPLHLNWGKLFLYWWKTGERQAIDLMPGHGNYYGPLYYALNYVSGDWLVRHTPLSFVASHHVITLFTASLCVGLTFILARRFFGSRVAWLAAIFFVLYPPLVAHAHYNPKDIPLMFAALLVILSADTVLRKRGLKTALIAGSAFGFAVALKISAVILGPILVFAYIADILLHRPSGWLLRDIKILVVFLLSAGIVGFVFWPTLWGDPSLFTTSLKFFATGNFWPGKELFFGTLYPGAELPWFYTPFMFFVATPFMTLLSLSIGGYASTRSIIRRHPQTVRYILLLSWLIFPILVTLKPGLVRYDGIRQFFFVVPALAILAGLGLDRLIDLLLKKTGKKWMRMAVTTVAALWLLIEIVIAHPFEGSYVNEITRASIPSPIERSLEIEYWGATYKQGLQWLNENAEPNAKVCVPIAPLLISWYQWRGDLKFECDALSNYIMFFTRYGEANQYALLESEPVYRISRSGGDLLKIFKVR